MRKTIVILLSCTVVLLLGFCAYRAYELWKQGHWMTLAKAFAAQEDATNERLALDQALRMNPRNIEACRMMAYLEEATHKTDALKWRQDVVDLDPTSLDDRLALAQTALLFRDNDTASNALAGVDDAGKKTPAFYNTAGELALANRSLPEAESDFAEAVRLDPSNYGPQLNLSVVQLHSTNTLDMDEARITLKRISMNATNLNLRYQADRELAIDALRFKDANTALSYSSQLQQQANIPFQDNLLQLEALKLAGSADYESALKSNEHLAATNSTDLYELALWLLEHNLSRQALGWMQTLPANVQTNTPGAVLIAQCQMVEQNWSGLQSSISKQNWGPLEYTRLAYLSRALREQGLDESSRAQWDVALRAANGEKANMIALLRLAGEWNWQDDVQQLLQNIFNTFPEEQWAGQQLSVILYNTGSTRSLMELYSTQSNRHPEDVDAENNLALTALLLHAQEMKPYDLAKDVYQKAPTNPSYACTYAFALYLQGKSTQALKIMQSIPPQALNDNSTAGYYGVILKATGNNTQAKTYLQRSFRGQLLPEEHALFQQAMSGI